jgi:hypothetical protein
MPARAFASCCEGTAVPYPSAVTGVRAVHTSRIGLHDFGHDIWRHGCSALEMGRNGRDGNREIRAAEWGLRPFLTLDVEP